MSASTLCQGCGGRVVIPEDFDRARIRCPQCGVMCDVPARPANKTAAPKPRSAEPARAVADDDDVAEALLLPDDPPPRPAPQPAPRGEKTPRQPKLALPPPTPTKYEHSHDDDGKPYWVTGLDDERPCPGCRKMIARDAVVCTSCGLDLRVGKKMVQEFQPVEREWQAGLSLPARLIVFAGVEAVLLPLMIWSATAKEVPIFGVFFPWLVCTAMLAFLLGTYDKIHLKRNKKGRVRITKTWCICFIPRPPIEIDVHNYSGVVYGQSNDTTGMEWFMMFLLLGFGIIPGIIFGIMFVFRSAAQVALTRDHGHAAFILYRGSDRDMMLDIAETVRDVAHMPADGG